MTTTDTEDESTTDESNRVTTDIHLCTPSGDTISTIEKIAGNNSFGPGSIENHTDVYERLNQLDSDAPIVISGGGTLGTPEFKISRFEAVEQKNEGVYVTFRPKLTVKGRKVKSPRRDERSVRLGSWTVHLPVSNEDSNVLDEACSAYTSEDTKFFLQYNRDVAERNGTTYQEFASLEPGDEINTGPYSTPLVVISEQYDTIVKKTSSINDRRSTVDVRGITVSNPRGGYYQLGISIPDIGSVDKDSEGIFAISESIKHHPEKPTFYISRSSRLPQPPNAVFVMDTAFGPSDFSVEKRGGKDPDVVDPDEELLESPLPPRAIQDSLNDVEGIGEKTSRSLYNNLDDIVTAHQLAYSLFGEGEHDETVIRETLKSVPQKSDILNRLYNIYTSDINPDAPEDRPGLETPTEPDEGTVDESQKDLSAWS